MPDRKLERKPRPVPGIVERWEQNEYSGRWVGYCSAGCKVMVATTVEIAATLAGKRALVGEVAGMEIAEIIRRAFGPEQPACCDESGLTRDVGWPCLAHEVSVIPPAVFVAQPEPATRELGPCELDPGMRLVCGDHDHIVTETKRDGKYVHVELAHNSGCDGARLGLLHWNHPSHRRKVVLRAVSPEPATREIEARDLRAGMTAVLEGAPRLVTHRHDETWRGRIGFDLAKHDTDDDEIWLHPGDKITIRADAPAEHIAHRDTKPPADPPRFSMGWTVSKDALERAEAEGPKFMDAVMRRMTEPAWHRELFRQPYADQMQRAAAALNGVIAPAGGQRFLRMRSSSLDTIAGIMKESDGGQVLIRNVGLASVTLEREPQRPTIRIPARDVVPGMLWPCVIASGFGPPEKTALAVESVARKGGHAVISLIDCAPGMRDVRGAGELVEVQLPGESPRELCCTCSAWHWLALAATGALTAATPIAVIEPHLHRTGCPVAPTECHGGMRVWPVQLRDRPWRYRSTNGGEYYRDEPLFDDFVGLPQLRDVAAGKPNAEEGDAILQAFFHPPTQPEESGDRAAWERRQREKGYR